MDKERGTLQRLPRREQQGSAGGTPLRVALVLWLRETSPWDSRRAAGGERVLLAWRCEEIPQYRTIAHQVGSWKRSADGNLSCLPEPGGDSVDEVLVLTCGAGRESGWSLKRKALRGIVLGGAGLERPLFSVFPSANWMFCLLLLPVTALVRELCSSRKSWEKPFVHAAKFLVTAIVSCAFRLVLSLRKPGLELVCLPQWDGLGLVSDR